MESQNTPGSPYDPPATVPASGTAFPWERLLLSVLFAVVAWTALWVVLMLAVIMWILIAVSREPHPQFRAFVRAGARYVSQCLAYVLTLTDERPFPLGPLPSGEP